MHLPIALIVLHQFAGLGYRISAEVENEDARCEIMMEKIISNDEGTATDDTASRLHSTWVSQECEVRAGPKYITRKYSFFKNGSFLLLQFHYSEESCSIATYNVVARGCLQLLSPSISVPGATKANMELDSVHLIPLNRQVAHKFARRMNESCGGIGTKWRPYLAQLIYERPTDPPFDTSLQMHDLKFNSLQNRLLPTRKQYTLNCLESFGIEFTELRLLRVEIKKSNAVTKLMRRDAVVGDKTHARVELFLGGLARNVHSQNLEPRPKRLQATSMVRANTAINCPICANVFRATEYSPPFFHQVPSLPAVIGGLWLSIKCESVDGGFWSRRFLRIYSDDNRWSARWTYYADSACSNLIYSVTAAGTYVQRAIRQTRNVEYSSAKIVNADPRLDTFQEKLELKVYPFLVKTNFVAPSGTTKLELQFFKSLMSPVDKVVSTRCLTEAHAAREIKSWPRNCIPRTVRASVTLTFKVKISLDWNGDYTLFLASWKDDIWEAPLYRCSGTSTRYYLQELLREYLSLSVKNHWYESFNPYAQHWFSSSFASGRWTRSSFINLVILLFWLCWLRLIF